MRSALLCLALAWVLGLLLPLPAPDSVAALRAEHLARWFVPAAQESALAGADAWVTALRAMPPLQQMLVLGMAMVRMVCTACLAAYFFASLTAVIGMGGTLLRAAVAGMLVVVAGAVGWKAPAVHFRRWWCSHAEFGPFTRRLQAGQWRRRLRNAAREHGFVAEY